MSPLHVQFTQFRRLDSDLGRPYQAETHIRFASWELGGLKILLCAPACRLTGSTSDAELYVYAMNNLLRTSRCMLRLVAAHSYQPHAQIADAKIGRSVGPEISALLLCCRNINTSPVVSELIRQPVSAAFISISGH